MQKREAPSQKAPLKVLCYLTPEGDKKLEGTSQEDNKPVIFTQEQVDDIVSKRLAEANTKAEKKLKDEISKAVTEVERRSKYGKLFIQFQVTINTP